VLELLRALEKRRESGGVRRPVIILGGPEASYLPEVTRGPLPAGSPEPPAETELFRYADWVIRGEGELVFGELCRALLKPGGPGDLPAWIETLPPVRAVHGKFIDARPVSTAPVKPRELPAVRIPAVISALAPETPAAVMPGYRLYTGEDLRRKLVYVEASRGCPFGCEFCQSSINSAEGGKVREFPLEPFLAEMKGLISRGGRAFKFLDRSFNLNIERARRIMEFFLEQIGELEEAASGEAASVPDRPLYAHFEMVPSRFPPELRETLRRFPPGSLRLEIGIQTFNQKTAALIGRPSDPAKELEALEFLRRETNALVHADLIAGLPGEDMISLGKGFDRLWLVRPAEIQLGILKCLPGTPILRHTEAWGMRYAGEPPYEILETAALPPADLERIKNFARFWELIVNRGAFPDLIPVLFPRDRPVFGAFMTLSDRLLARFRRNWGIDRKDLRAALEEQNLEP
jgi:radical SAM superfamily enzyme YgiQ (UPF0313 family)